ncbi:MAG TPA: GNAT family N-acetyltransferase [Lacipirellulaceae bacterium]|nr:GNAT family N-acetyltransferase [Lacipirellulaceae bacterium]
MEVETLDRRRLSERDARAIAELVAGIWPKPGRTVESLAAEMVRQWLSYAGPEEQHPRSYVVREGDRVIAHASFDPRTISAGDKEITVLALARVCSDPAVRGRRLGRAVVQAAFELVDQGAFPFSLFQTTNEVQPFYERLGAVRIHNRFVNSLATDPKADPWWNPVIMRYPDGPGWPAGEIDLRGPGW